MKIEDVRPLLEPVKVRAEKDGDKYCIVYFSRDEDMYAGAWELDAKDALIVIAELIKKCDLKPDALIEIYGEQIAEKFDLEEEGKNEK